MQEVKLQEDVHTVRPSGTACRLRSPKVQKGVDFLWEQEAMEDFPEEDLAQGEQEVMEDFPEEVPEDFQDEVQDEVQEEALADDLEQEQAGECRRCLQDYPLYSR